VFCALGVLTPVGYIVLRAVIPVPDALAHEQISPFDIVFHWRNAQLLLNTVLLVAGVLAVTVSLAVPAAWLTTCTSLPGRRLFTLLGVLPLVVPGYLMAYTFRSLGGEIGVISQLFGIVIPRPSGYFGALLALSLYNFPYMFLNLRASLRELDPALEESARTLGSTPPAVFTHVVLPQLRPAMLTGAFLIGLHVIADFGVVSIMNFDTFSLALFQQYGIPNRTASAWLALMVIAMAVIFLATEALLLRGLRLDRVGSGTNRMRRRATLGWWTLPAIALLTLLAIVSVGVPVSTIAYWSLRCTWSLTMLEDVRDAIVNSLSGSVPAAIVATAMAIPIAYMARRYPSKRSFYLERVAYLGFATPPLAFALGLIFVAKYTATVLEYSLVLLVFAYSMHFLAEAVGPLRNSLYRASPRIEEAARSLGCNGFTAFWRVTFPVMRNGIVVACALVFLSCMKELPLTMMLAPHDFHTLAYDVYSYASDDAMFHEAAPYAVAILLVSTGLVAVLLMRGRKLV
jgi:iron(III) transport system permease protein